MSSRKIRLILVEIVMFVTLFALLFGIYFGNLLDWQIRILGITVAIDLVAIVYNTIQLKKKEFKGE